MDLESTVYKYSKALVFSSVAAGSAYLIYKYAGPETFKMHDGRGLAVPFIAGYLALAIYEKIKK